MNFSLPFTRRSAQLPPDTAEQILSNVFTACKREPNSVPLEALTSYSNYRKERYALQRSLILLMLALFMLLPLLFLAASVTVMQVNPGSEENPVYAISVDTRIPIRQVEARLAGQTVPLYEVSPGSYTAIPRSNGEMQIEATLLNKQETRVSLQIDHVDTAAPTLLSTEIGADRVSFFVEDTGSGVDYAGVTLTDDTGSSLAPLELDPQRGCIVFPYPTSTLHIGIPDQRGNVLRIDLKPQR